MDLYSTTTLLEFIQAASPTPTFLKERYASRTDTFGTETVLAEYRDAERRIAPIVTDLSGGVGVSRNGQYMREFKPPLVELSRPLTINDLEKRGFGEALYPQLNASQREAKLVTQDMMELDAMITRREEWMVAQTLLENALVAEAVNDDPEEQQKLDVKFYREGEKSNPATHVVGTTWDKEDADPLKDIAESIEMLEDNGLPAEDLLMAPDVADALMRNPKVQSFLDNRRYFWGESQPRVVGTGAALVSVLNVAGHDINCISYGAKYVEGVGKQATVKPFMPKGTAVLTAPNCLRTVYGAVTLVEGEYNNPTYESYPAPRVPERIADKKGKSIEIHLSSRPLVIPIAMNPAISMKSVTA